MQGNNEFEKKIIVICGPTASGKTTLAVKVAQKLLSLNIQTEIISADSRQVYKGMDIGTGKDLDEYNIDSQRIATHCLDVADPMDNYTLSNYIEDCTRAINHIQSNGGIPILCGGTGLYIEAILKNFKLPEVAEDIKFREKMMKKEKAELQKILNELDPIRFTTTDTNSVKRLVRALEIHQSLGPLKEIDKPQSPSSTPTQSNFIPLILITKWERQSLIERIDKRLEQRLEMGMIDEVQKLIDNGTTYERLKLFGMEYGHIGDLLFNNDGGYEQSDISKMKELLANSIHRLSKRQMTWFRGMERRGFNPQWIDKTEFTVAWENIKNFLSLEE